MATNFTLVLGGARSGKSAFAHSLAGELGRRVLFVATAEPLDEEMEQRIKEHRYFRPENWETLEVSHNIVQKLTEKLNNVDIVLLDCITLLVSNLMLSNMGDQVVVEIEGLIKCVGKWDGSFIAVSNEVGLGLVPEDKLSRDYRDLLGKANQLLAKHASQVYFMVSGIPLKIKG